MTMTATTTALSSTQVVRRLKGRITYRQLDYWTRNGRITPAFRDGEGTGNGRLWSEDDVIALEAILDVLDRHASELAQIVSGEMWDDVHEGISRLHREFA
jgi:DNA-binding transcriptional MerR regulator